MISKVFDCIDAYRFNIRVLELIEVGLLLDKPRDGLASAIVKSCDDISERLFHLVLILLDPLDDRFMPSLRATCLSDNFNARLHKESLNRERVAGTLHQDY